MSIFNSLGSNYNLKFALKTLFTPDLKKSAENLKKLLEEKYGGQVVLLYKGREAIILALQTLKLPKDSYVAICGFTCFAVYQAVKNAGLNVEYLDIDRGELNFSKESLEEAIKKNKKIKAVIIQNTLGYPCQIAEISQTCKDNNITLIEDLAHCVGTKYVNGSEAGTAGDMTILSFSQDKMIDGISGGALITKNQISSLHLEGVSTKKQIIDKLYPLFTYLIRKTYPIGLGKLLHFILKKLNLLSTPMTNITGVHQLPSWYAKLINQQFKDLDDNLNSRKIIASIYAKLINPKILSHKLVDKIHFSANLRFPIFVTNRESLIKYLSKHGIYVSDIWYDAPIAPKKYLSQTDYQGQCPNGELASSAILNLPTHRNVSEEDAKNISNLVNQWLKLQ